MSNEISTPLFIFEMANNHMGDVNHGIRIVRELAEVTRDFDFKFGVKLQYRDLDTFIHPDFKNRMDVKYVKRFSETRLSGDEFKRLKDEIQSNGFLSICTPFDERSVDLIEKHEFDIIKIASCSLTDWPLLERIVTCPKPVIASTAAVTLEQVDKVVSFFEHRQRSIALMHCVAEYPTKDENLQINQIALLRRRYPNHIVGYSTHESPDNLDAVKVAVGQGAEIYEKHVGVPTETIALNAYSATPVQVRDWLNAARRAFAMCGVANERHPFSEKEMADLHSLRRGVFAKSALRAGQHVAPEDVFYAIPTVPDQLVANEMSKYTSIRLGTDIAAGEPLLHGNIQLVHNRERVEQIAQQVRKFVKKTRLILPHKADLEISHHYGIENFSSVGAILLTYINREYCKKMIVMLPGQKHPEHYHKLKEETFHVQFGEMTMWLNGHEKSYKAGDLILVPREVKHSFATKTGVVFEEISSTHYPNDSFYLDEAITNNLHRKTLLTYWM